MDLRIRVPSNRDSSNGPEILAVTWALTSIALAVVILKIWTRIKLIRHTGPEDVLTAIAVVGGP